MNDFARAVMLAAEVGGYEPEEVLEQMAVAHRQIVQAYSKENPPHLVVEEGAS
jgi:hypothetical protein